MADTDGFTRPLPQILALIAEYGQKRAAAVASRDRRNQDMLDALSDVEAHEARIARLDKGFDALVDERRRAEAQP